MSETSFICSCCNPSQSYAHKRGLRKHQKTHDSTYVYGGSNSAHEKIRRLEEYLQNPKKCKNCRESFPYEKYIDDHRADFCSRKCWGESRTASAKTKPKLRNVSGQRFYDHYRICEYCSKELTGSALKYCKGKCQNAAKRQGIVNLWLKDPSVGTDAADNLRPVVRDWLIKNVGHKCEECGWSKIHPITGRIPLQIDHRDGNHLNNTRENLKVLCPNCHSLTENFGSLNKGNGREYRREYRKALRSVLRESIKENEKCESQSQPPRAATIQSV